MSRKPIDWEAIEIQYRAGIRSLKEIGAEFGVSDAGIIKRARRDGWTRDLRAKIQAKADAKVSAALVSAEVSAEAKLTERTVIEVNATVVANVRLAHRKDIGRARGIHNRLLDQLSEALENRGEIEEAIEHETAGDKTTLRRNMMLKAVALPTHAGVLKDLATASKTLIDLERQAFGMGSVNEPETPATPATEHSEVEIARRLAFVLAQGRQKLLNEKDKA